jgi:hypothetical protein
MAKKIVLESRSEPTFFTFIGISCHLLDYRLLYEFNKQLEFSFSKECDFLAPILKGKKPIPYSFYLYKDEDHRLTYYLLSNRSEEGLLFPTIKQADYMLIIEGEIKKQKTETFLSSLRTVPKVLMAFEIKATDLKGIEIFLMDLELHVLEIIKESKLRLTTET